MKLDQRQYLSLALFGLLVLQCTALLSQTPSEPVASSPTQQLHQALDRAEHGNKQEAMDLVLRLLQRHPDFESAVKLKGMLLEEQGRSNEAAATYAEALKLAPNDPDVLLKVGAYKLAAGQKEEAINLLQRCIRILPGDGDAHYYLAQAYHLNGQDDLALRAIRQSLKAEPDNPSVWQKYGELLCGSRQCAAALKWLLKAQRSDPTLPTSCSGNSTHGSRSPYL